MFTKVPPDGGWGWFVVLANALNALATIPIIQGFGLIFKDSFTALNMTATDMSIIINVNLAFGMILGLINGPLLKTLGYRKVALIGSIFYSTGLTLTAFANSFTLIIICYGLLASIGMSMAMAGFSLATNSYFTTKRGRAMGLTMTIMGLGPIFMPQITSILLSYYGIQGTVLIFGAYSLHSMIGVALLQPVKWHMKNAPLCLETVESPQVSTNDKEDKSDQGKKDEANMYSPIPMTNERRRKLTVSSIDYDIDVGSTYGFDTPLPPRVSINRTLSYDSNYDTEMSMINETNLRDKYFKYPWLNSAKSIDSINLGSSIKIFDEPIPIPMTKKLTFIDVNDMNKTNGVIQNPMEKDSLLEKEPNNCSVEENCDKNESTARRIWRRIVDLYDFDLLRDPIYVNIMLGMSIAVFAEANFSMLTPFILADMNLTTAKIANVMSVSSIVDLFGRSVAPFLGEWMRQPPRIMYMISLCLLIISRSSLLFANSFTSILISAIGWGGAKGIRSVYMTLVVPSYVPIHKLPNASGIQMLTNGMILMFVGPVLGSLRDATGSYTICIILINCMTAITIIMWTTELLLIRRRKLRQKSKLHEKS